MVLRQLKNAVKSVLWNSLESFKKLFSTHLLTVLTIGVITQIVTGNQGKEYDTR